MKGNKLQQQKFMRARVIAQGLTFTVVFLSMAAQERAEKRAAENASATQSPPGVAGMHPSRAWQHVGKDPDFPWELYTCSEFWPSPCSGLPQEPSTCPPCGPLPYTV